MTPSVDSGPDLLLDWHESADPHRYWWAGAGSLVVHAAIIALVVLLASLAGPPQREGTEIVPDFRQAVHLTLPADLTQKAPNKGKVAKEVDVESLKPRPASKERLPPVPSVRAFQPPKPQPLGLPQPGPARIATPPKIETPLTAQNAPPVPPALAGTPKALPPQIQPVEQPKLAFETPGQQGPSEHKGQGKLAPPRADVQSVVRGMAGGGGGQGNVGNLEQPPELPGSVRLPSLAGQQGIAPELLSDPMGADFKPYLMQVLARVRSKWLALLPESARTGNRGVVQIEFIINQVGAVPKLVIATESGSRSLDLAAVAGIDQSQPFPPFPKEFKGQEIRLRFAFKYNVN